MKLLSFFQSFCQLISAQKKATFHGPEGLSLPCCSEDKQCFYLCGVFAHHAQLDSLFPHVSNVPQLEMSKQDDRGSEESANQTSVSEGKRFEHARCSKYCFVSPHTPHSSSSCLWLSSLTSSSNMTESLQATLIVCDCICRWINHPDTTGLGRRKGVIKSEWPTHVHMSTCLNALSHTRRFFWWD